jgi:hypothetical protein
VATTDSELTMLDMAAISQKPLVKGVMMAMFKGRLPSPMERLPVKTTTALSQRVSRLTDAGAPTTRNINETVTVYSAHFTTGVETLKIIENKILIDKVLLAEQNHIQDPIVLQTKTYASVVRNTVNDLLINGDPVADESQPAGLQYRLGNDSMFLNQCVDAGSLDVDANEATRLSWLDYLDEAITLCGGGNPDICIVNRQTWIKFRSALRAQKLLDTTRDQFDRVIMQYGNLAILDAGQVPASVLVSTAAGQVILDDGITDVFGNTTVTPMYLLDTKSDEGCKLLQLHGLKVTKLGLDHSDPGQFVVDVTWPIGFHIPQKFALSSVQGLDIT